LQRRGVGELLLVARRPQPLLDLQSALGEGRILSQQEALAEADAVVWVASLPQGLSIDASSLRRPCLMIDGGYPKNLDSRFAGDGVHVIKGGIVEFWQDIGWQTLAVAEMDNPRRQLFACFAEAMLLEFEAIHTNFSWGRNNISLANMELIGEASLRHGFKALGLDPARLGSSLTAV
jgi:fatty aldehyde-generating acyl-ACP reductase